MLERAVEKLAALDASSGAKGAEGGLSIHTAEH